MRRERDLKIKDFSDIPELPDECFDPNMPKRQKFAVLSLNPGIDRALYLPSPMEAGSLNRAARSVTTQGSKGANVAIMLHRLGCDVEYYTFGGGEFGDLSNSFLTREGVKVNSVDTVCGVRMNTKVIDSECVCTELNERGGVFLPLRPSRYFCERLRFLPRSSAFYGRLYPRWTLSWDLSFP